MEMFQVDGISAKYYRAWLSKPCSDHLFSKLLETIFWKEEHLPIFGKKIKVPRLVSWIADPNIYYFYSGVNHHPLPWPSELVPIRDGLNKYFKIEFNSVLCNLYRTSKDYIGWHRDNEPELGEHPTIASISLGAERKFSFRHRKSKRLFHIALNHGSLLLMYGICQDDWEHSLPKALLCTTCRINLTFRRIQTKT